MTTSITQEQEVSEAVQEVLLDKAKEIERRVGFVQRSTVVLDGPRFVQTTSLTWMHNANAGYSQLQHTAASVGAQVSSQAIQQRFSQASVRLLREVWQAGIEHLIASEPVGVPVLSRFAGVYLQDGTVISLPDSLREQWPAGGGEGEQAAMRVQVRMQMQTGEIAGMWVQPTKEAERSGEPMNFPLPVGSLFIGDTGYFTLAGMRERSEAGEYFLTQAKASVQVRDSMGVWRDLLSFLREHPDGPVDEWVLMGKREQVPVRLIAVHLSEEQAQRRRTRAGASITHPPKGIAAPQVGEATPQEQRQGKKKRKKVSEARLKLSEWTLLVTNVPKEQVTVEEAVVLMRYRWQLELYWKLWKQRGKVDTWRSQQPERIETEIFAKLVGLLITQWLTLVGCWSSPTRSMMKAKGVVEWMTPCIGLALAGLLPLLVVVQRTVEMMAGSGCQVDTRHHRPNAGQLIQQPTLIRGLG